MDSIDLLERRIAALELKVLPLQNESEETSTQSITEMLLQINTLISSALSCREVVTAIMNRMTELNEYLEPTFYESRLNTSAKKQFILSIYPEIQKYGESIRRLKKLVPVLDSEPLHNFTSLVPKLEQLTLANLEIHDQNQEVSKNIAEALQQYNNIIYSITRIFVQLEEVVTHLELVMKKKSVVE